MLMLLDFTTSSFQLASLLISIIMQEASALLYFGIVCFTMMLYQIIALYWFANEIKIQSFAISLATYEIPWYTFSTSMNIRIQIIIMRSQKSLALYIGPFGEMSLEKAVSIIKTAYSFTAFMYR
ncbi:odorant receptor 49b [Aethina tumida]|uniref:odorant receptor 49b n=1 Tax=Aethina tumida TaxID=116153 RepID=UPI00096B58A0|nr:odorant receptor 49b [Aethina tumida]